MARPMRYPYAAVRKPYGFDGRVGDRVRSLVQEHEGRDGTVQVPHRSEGRRVMVLLDGDAEPVAIEPTLVRAIHPSHLARIHGLGLEVVCLLVHRDNVPVDGGDAPFEPLPQDMIARDGAGLVIWRDADRRYDFAGWLAWRRLSWGGVFSGRRPSIHSALSWYARALDVEAGRADDFTGV